MIRVTLLSPRLIMEPPVPREAEQFAEWLNDPWVVKFSEQRHKKHTRQSQCDYWLSTATIRPNSVYSIYLFEPRTLIGSISAKVDANNGVANVGILIGDKTKWGKGIGIEAWTCFCNYLFYEEDIRKIEAGCMSVNSPMIRVMEKFGMRLEGTIKEHFELDGGYSDMLLYGKLR